MSAPPARAAGGLLLRLAAAAARNATGTPSTAAASLSSSVYHRALLATSASPTPAAAAAATAAAKPSAAAAAAAATAPPSSPARRPPRRQALSSFASTTSRNPFAGLAKVDLSNARFRLVDARGQVLGRLASHVASMLQGKDRPTFDPSDRAGGDVCVVVNASEVALTGRKWERKVYRRHSGRPGGMKERTAIEAWRRDPASLVEKAVAGMLPRSGAGRRDRLRRLRVFAGDDHPFAHSGGSLELVPSPPPPRALRDKGQGWQLPEGFEPMNPEAYARRMRGGKGGVARGARPAGGEPLPAFDDLLVAGEAEVVRSAAVAKAEAAAAAGRGGGDGAGK